MSGVGDRRVVVTGVGVITPLGDRPETLHGALCEGRSALAPVEKLEVDSDRMPRLPAAELKWFESRSYLGKGNLRPLDRTGRLAASAAALALEASGWSAELLSEHEVGLVLGTMFGSMRTISEFDRRAQVDGPKYAKPMHFANTVINAAAGQTAIWHGLTGINATVSGGTVSGLQAIGYAADLIRQGRATTLLAGGAEELCFETLYGFYRAGLLGGCDAIPRPVPLDSCRNGFALGEAAVLLMLEEAEAARSRGARVLAEVSGCGVGYDLSRGADPQQDAEATSSALTGALADGGAAADSIDALVLSANGSVSGDRVEAAGVEQVWNGGSAKLPVTAPKSMLGESLGASGALQTVVLIEAMRSGLLPGIHGLEEMERGMPLRMATAGTISTEISRGMVLSHGLNGKSAALLVEEWRG
jgi:3-oxoacyl-[acyl-carrier-protein] synthase II